MIILLVIYGNVPVVKNQQIQNFHFLKYVRICAENTLRKKGYFQ